MKNNSKYKKLIIICIVVVLILCMLLAIISVLNKNGSIFREQENGNTEIVLWDDLKTVEEVINHCNAKYVSEIVEGNFKKINVEFARDLYKNDESNEQYFLGIVTRVSYFYKYSVNYILKDDTRNIEIKVYAQTNKIEVNGESEYFVKRDNILALNNKKKEKLSNAEINSEELEKLIDLEWSKSFDFEDDYVMFCGYKNYYNKGIKVKSGYKNIQNIIFSSNYRGPVINGIDCSFTFEEVQKKLGHPNYKSPTSIGYKFNNIYVYFCKNYRDENEISVFYNKKEEVDEELEKLVKEYLTSKIDIKEFMDELTDLCPDYYEYNYSNSYINIKYPNKGFKVSYGESTENMISVYDSYEIGNVIKNYLINGKVKGELDNSLYTEIIREKSILENKIYSNNLEKTKSSEYKVVYEKNDDEQIEKAYFIALKDDLPDFEFKKSIDEGLFMNDEIFIYSIHNKGIYYINVLTRDEGVIVEGFDEFVIEKYENNSLYYDNEIIWLEME